MSAAVIVVGSINIDFFTYVATLPRPGETVVGGTFSRAHGGKGANQAVAASRLGAEVWLIGMVGDDDLGASARAELEGEGVRVDELVAADNHTGVAQILVDSRGENLIAVALGANSDVTATMVESALGQIDAGEAIVCAVLEVPEEAVLAAAAIASERGWRFVLNPAPARPLPAELVSRCDVLTPNEHEVAELGADSPEDLLAMGAGAVVVTRGAAGAELYRRGLEKHHQAAFEADAVDTTGAGDAFSGALCWALAERTDLEEALRLAAAAAALSTQRPGARAGMPTRAQLIDFLRVARAGTT